jgi:hypothetical protein
MSTDHDLAGWGEPPATPAEQAEADRLADALDRLQRGEPAAAPDQPLRNELLPLEQAASVFRRQAGLLDDSRTRSVAAAPALPDWFPGKYRFERLLGQGAFGEVWLAEEVHVPGSRVALKALRPGGDPATAAVRLDALRREAMLLRELRHRHIVPIYTWEQQGAEHFLVMRFVPGGSLEERLRAGPLPWEDAARFVADVAEGLVHAHGRGVIHRDIKPANILCEGSEALLTDFGVAGRLGGPGGRAGTPLYMAPEAFAGRLTPQMDVYSLAVTLFRLATGAYPFLLPPGTTTLHDAAVQDLLDQVHRGLPEPDARCAGLPQALERLIRDGLKGDADRRPGLARFLEGLRGALNQSLADSLPVVEAEAGAAPVQLHLRVSRLLGPNDYRPVAARGARLDPLARNMKRVPPPPEQVPLRTGDRVRVEVLADRTGYVTVFNVGPTGDLNLLFPDEPAAGAGPTAWANQPLQVPDVELQPPAGRERLFAVWSRRPLALSLEQLHGAVARGEVPLSEAYRATRNMVKVKQSVAQLPRGEWQAVVLELDHRE